MTSLGDFKDFKINASRNSFVQAVWTLEGTKCISDEKDFWRVRPEKRNNHPELLKNKLTDKQLCRWLCRFGEQPIHRDRL